MLQNRSVQMTAQKHIDALLHGQRLPNFDDIESLPYITAIMKEVLRWRPVTPLGRFPSRAFIPGSNGIDRVLLLQAVPHALMMDDEYRGYHLPKGSIVVGNSW